MFYYDKDILYLSRKKNRFDKMPKSLLFEAFGELKTWNEWLKDDRRSVSKVGLRYRIKNTNMTLEECLLTKSRSTDNMYKNNTNNQKRQLIPMEIYPIEEFPKIGQF